MLFYILYIVSLFLILSHTQTKKHNCVGILTNRDTIRVVYEFLTLMLTFWLKIHVFF